MLNLILFFVVDNTGSMGSYIAQAQENIRKIIEQIHTSEKADIRFALVMYRDYPPQDSSYITQVKEFTSSVETMREYVNLMSASGGGDAPECVTTGLYEALVMDYRPKATKIIALIADAPPHGIEESDGFPNGDPLTKGSPSDLIEIVDAFAKKGLVLYCVGCEPAISGYPRTPSLLMALSQKTGGQYVPLSAAHFLSQVIVGGCREELSLDRISGLVIETAKKDWIESESK